MSPQVKITMYNLRFNITSHEGSEADRQWQAFQSKIEDVVQCKASSLPIYVTGSSYNSNDGIIQITVIGRTGDDRVREFFNALFFEKGDGDIIMHNMAYTPGGNRWRVMGSAGGRQPRATAAAANSLG